MAKTKAYRVAERAVRVLVWLDVLISVPLYMWFLVHVSGRVSEQLPAEDALGFWLPIVVPCAAFSFTLMSSVSWWWSTASRPFLLGRTGWWVPMVFVTALSFLVGVFGSTTPDVEAALFTAMVTTMGFTGLWLLPPALSRNLIDTLSPNTSPADPA